MIARKFLLLLFALTLTSPAGAASIRVLAANGISIPARELAPAFEKETGHRVAFTFGSPGVVNDRLAAGESYDLVVLPTDAARERESAWLPNTRKPMARLGIGIAVRTGVTLDLSTVESTRRLLLAARSIALSDGATGGLSRPNSEKVLANLGIFDAVKGKIIYAEDGQALVAKGDAELGMFNMSEIPRAAGVARAGAIPAAAQVYIIYDSVVPKTNTAPDLSADLSAEARRAKAEALAKVDAALALVAFLSQPAAKASWEKAGLSLATE
jgi:molybdate transport system substrate-binding protein